MTRPLIQVDDIGTTREMTDEEQELYEQAINQTNFVPIGE
jgi:hypothetical protein